MAKKMATKQDANQRQKQYIEEFLDLGKARRQDRHRGQRQARPHDGSPRRRRQAHGDHHQLHRSALVDFLNVAKVELEKLVLKVRNYEVKDINSAHISLFFEKNLLYH